MQTFAIDSARTRLSFVVPGLLRTQGEFTRIVGTGTADEQGCPHALEVTISAGSLRTGLSARDLHLKSASFLDARRYPTITYHSQYVERIEPNRYTIHGVLRLHGREHPITLDAVLDPDAEPDRARRVHVIGALPRSAFGIPRNAVLRALLPAMIGDSVALSADVCVTPVRESVASAPLSAM